MGAGGSQKIFVTVNSYSKRGQLLKRPDLQTLAESRDLDELVTRIKNTKYIDQKIFYDLNIESISGEIINFKDKGYLKAFDSIDAATSYLGRPPILSKLA